MDGVIKGIVPNENGELTLVLSVFTLGNVFDGNKAYRLLSINTKDLKRVGIFNEFKKVVDNYINNNPARARFKLERH